MHLAVIVPVSVWLECFLLNDFLLGALAINSHTCEKVFTDCGASRAGPAWFYSPGIWSSFPIPFDDSSKKYAFVSSTGRLRGPGGCSSSDSFISVSLFTKSKLENCKTNYIQYIVYYMHVLVKPLQ